MGKASTHYTTTDALRNAALALDQEVAKLEGYEPSILRRELYALGEWLRAAAGDEADGNATIELRSLQI